MEHLPDVRTFENSPSPYPLEPDNNEQLSETAQRLLYESIPKETRKAYEREWGRFLRWCAVQRCVPLPASETTLTNWVASRIAAQESLTYIAQGISAVRRAHFERGLDEQPPSKRAWTLYRKYRVDRIDAGWRPTKSATLTVEEFRRMISVLPRHRVAGTRDAAILAVGVSGFFRRSNIVRLDIGDVLPTERGDVVLTVTRSKTDQAARGRRRVIPAGEHPLSDPVGLLDAWLDALAEQDVTDGPLFRPISRSGRILDRRLHADWVRRLVKDTAAKAGLKSPRHRPYRAHSLRSSGVTMARRAGKPWSLIQEQGDWSDRSPVVFGYEQPEEQDNAMRGVL